MSNLQSPKYFNTNTSHPIIQNAGEYIYYKKYVSIHSEDRDMIKFQNSSEFEIEMPEDLLNVAGIRLSDWTFPANYSTFSQLHSNVQMTFKINTPYKPPTDPSNNPQIILNQAIYSCLSDLSNTHFMIIINEGFYTPQQIVTELTNKFNNVVTKSITNYLTQNGLTSQLTLFNTQDGYTNFSIVYNAVGQRIWFGNICDGFILTNTTSVIVNTLTDNLYCGVKSQLPDFSSWGLPCNLGLTRSNSIAVNTTTSKSPDDPRFFYGDVNSGDKGNWLVPNTDLSGSQVWWYECDYKINLMGPSYFYMELEGQNCINETSPYNISKYTLGTNGTNGIVNSSFAKIAVPLTPITRWFEKSVLGPHKLYIPPAERIRRLKFKIRYHDGRLVNFGVFNYSFTLEFTMQSPQMVKESKAKIYPPII
jgi:hypothetical protein